MLNQVKKIVSIVLLVAMLITNNGFSVLATTVEQTSVESSEEIFESKKENISEPVYYGDDELDSSEPEEELEPTDGANDPTDGANDPTDGANDPTDGANVEPGVGGEQSSGLFSVHGARPESEEELEPEEEELDPTRRGDLSSEPEEEEEENLTEANADTSRGDLSSEPALATTSDIPSDEILPEEISDESETELTTVVDDIASVSEILIEEKKLNQIFGADDHTHKVCGIAPDLFCDHRGIESHGGEITYVPFFGEAVMTDEEIVDKIIAGGSYYLDNDINLPNVAQIRLTSDLYLCLNGKSVNNLFFGSGSNNDNKIYITNCILEQSTISREGDSVDFIVNHSDVSVIAPYSNIELNQATRFLYNVTTTNSKFDLYGLTFTTSATWPLTNSLIRSDSPGSEINMSHIYMSGFTTDGAFGYIQTTGSDSNKNKLNIQESKFEYLEHTGEGSVEKSLVWISHCDAVINSTSFIENSTGQIFYNTGSGTSDFRSVIMNNNTTLIWVVNLNYTTNNFDGVDIISNRWNSDTNNGGSLLELKYNAVLNVKSGGLKINYNTEFAPTPAVMYLNFDVVLNVEEGATCEIKNNTLPYYDSSNYNVFTICPGAHVTESSYTMNILGNFIVEDNNIVNATVPGTKPFAAIYLPNNKLMTMGNGTIKVQNNFIYSDRETRADETVSEFYHMYQVLTDNTNGVFVQSPGTELSTESRMTVAFASSPYVGTIVDSWTHSDPTAYKTIFSADKYRDDEFELIKDAENKLRIMSHVHKICGYGINEDCNHRGIATHSEIQSYALFFGGAELTDAQKRSRLAAGGSYRLDADVIFDNATDIYISNDLYLCLNGHTLYNAVFQHSSNPSNVNNHKLYITNCQKTEATISRITGEATFITNYSKVSIIAPYKNINLINSNRFKFEASSGSNKLDLYGTTFSQNPVGDIYFALISTTRGGSEINISNVNISNYIGSDSNFAIIDVGGASATNQSTLNIYESIFEKNGFDNYNFRKSIIYAYHCHTTICDTVFNENTPSSVFTNVSSGTSSLKNVDFTNNKTFGQIINLNATTNDFDNVNVLNNTRGITYNTSGVEAKSNAVLNIKSGGMRINNNKQGIAELDVVYLATNGVLNVEEGSTLEINDNVATYIPGTRAVYSVLLGSNDGNWRMNILGNLYIENNKLVSAPDTMTITYAGLYVPNNRNINIGNGIIRIQNNNIYTDAEGTVLSDALHPYQMLSSNTDGFLVQSPGTEIDADSKMEVAFDVAPYTGTIMDSFTHSDPKAYKTIFSADKYRDDEFEVVKYGNKLGIMTHGHKICGFESDVECDHRGIATHSEVVSYPAFFAGSDLTDEQIVNKLTAGGSYRLDRNIELASPRNIGISADLFLCLNGFNMKNVIFYNNTTSNNNKLYITNCKNEKVTISKDFSDNTGNFVINHSKVSIIAPYKNITLYNSFRIRYTLTTAVPIFDLYGLTISREGSTSIASSIIGTTAAGSEINISNIHISGFTTDSGFGYIQSNGSSSNKNKLNIYESKFDNIIHTGEGDVSKSLVHASHCDTIIHDTDFVDNQTGQIFYNTGSGTSDVKNVTMKNNTVLTWVVNVNYTTNNFDNVDIINNNWNNSGRCGALFDLKNNAILNVKSGGLRLNNNTELNPTPTVLYITSNAVLNVEEGATLEIKNNKLLYYNSKHRVFTICPGTYNTQDYTMNILGNFYVEDNKIINATTPASHPFAAVCFQRDRQMTVGNSIIKVQNNFIYSDAEGKTRADEKVSEYYHMYQVLSDSTNGTFVLSPGTEMSTDSRMEMAFYTSPYLGVIVDNWSHSDPNAYKTIFSADKFRDIDMMVVKDKDNKVRLMTHSHKVCGHAVDEDCTHTLVATHSEVYSYFPMTGVESIVPTLDSYRLEVDIVLDTPTVIDATRDLYICLNGHNVKNIYFTSTGGHTIYITNCKNKKVTFDTNTTEKFTTAATEIYGINKNITFKTAGIYAGSASTSHFYTYSVDFTQNSTSFSDSLLNSSANKTIYCEDTKFDNYELLASDTGKTMFHYMTIDDAQTNAITKFKNITASNIKNLNSRIMTVSSSAEMYWYGTNVVENISYKKRNDSEYTGIYIKGLFKIEDGTLTVRNNESANNSRDFMIIYNGVLYVEENASFVIDNNKKIYSPSTSNSFLKITATGSKIYGTLKIINNSIVQATSNTGVYLSAMEIDSGATIEIGNKPIIVQGNTSDGDPKTSIYQYLYQVLSFNINGFLTQKSGTEMHPDSRMQVQFADSPFKGVIANNWEHSDSAIYDTIFTADTFRDPNLVLNLNKNKQVEIISGGHLHKPCGVEKTTYCSHRGIDDHNYGIPYEDFSSGINMSDNTAITNRLQGGGYYYLSEALAPTANQPIVLEADLYLCLNGFNMSNISFRDVNNNRKVFITNCSYAEVVITQETETLFNILSSNIVAAKGRIRVVANGFFNVSYNTNALSLDCNFYNIISLPHDPSASSYQLFKFDNSTNQECKYVISKCIFKDHKKNSSSVLPIMYHRNVTGRVYDTDFIGIDTINSSFLVYEGSDLLYNKCNFNNITTGATSTGSLFRADKLDKTGEVKDSELTLEDVTIEGCTMNRSFVEINEIAQATVNVNNSFTAINNTVNKIGGNNFFNTKSLKLNDASLILKSNVSSNDGMPGLVRSQNSIELYNSYINISDNTIKRNPDGVQSILAVDNGNIKISDNSYLIIKNNKINTDGVNGNNNIIAALNLAADQTISIENGTSYVDISGNEAIGEYKDLDNNHVYQLYMTTADLFKIQNDGLIDMSKSYAEFALPSSAATGVLFPTWNGTTVKDWNANIHKNHFTASNFGNVRENIVINHFKHALHLDYISDSMDKTGEPLIPTPSNAEAHDEYGNDFVWWLAKTVKDAYGNDVELSEAEKNRALYIGTKWISAADNLYRTVFDLEPIYATAYTVTLHANGHGYGPNKETEVYNEGVKGDPFNLKQVFTPDRNYTFLYYNTKADGSGLRYNTGNYPKGLLQSRDDKLDLYAIYQYQKPPRDDDSSSSSSGGSGSGTINGPLQVVDYSYVEYPYHTLERVSIELANTVIWQKTDTSWNAFRVKYNNNAIVGYELLTDGLYFINWRNKNCYYAFDKAGNMISGFITYKGNIYCMAPTGTYQGAMIRSNAIIYDKDYIFAETGELTTVMKNYPGFVFDMDVGQYRYAMIGTNGPTYAIDTMIKLKQKDGSVISYYFDKQGLLKVGLIIYNNDIYFAYDTGTKYGQAMQGFMGAFNVLTNKLSEIHFNEDHSLDKIVIK